MRTIQRDHSKQPFREPPSEEVKFSLNEVIALASQYFSIKSFDSGQVIGSHFFYPLHVVCISFSSLSTTNRA